MDDAVSLRLVKHRPEHFLYRRGLRDKIDIFYMLLQQSEGLQLVVAATAYLSETYKGKLMDGQIQ